MCNEYFEDKDFDGIDCSEKELIKGNYENCTFNNCIFSNSDLSDIKFVECEFKNCDLSIAKISNTAFRDTKFITCKLLGLHFENCNKFLFSIDFKDCQLNLSSFYKLNLKNIKFKDCSLKEVDFSESDLTNIIFSNCDLSEARFENTILNKADFRLSYNFTIDPQINQIRKAKFSASGIMGLLSSYDIEVE